MLAVGERAARLHGDLPEHHFAQLVEQVLHEVGFADRHAAAGDHDVGGWRPRSLNARSSSFGIVAHHAHVDHLAAEPRQHAVERVAVAVVDLACARAAMPIERSSSPVEKNATRSLR